ncbi:EpsG family protein [Gammaproteobacteria bacterium]|nr:EpsG family protein [Gammaproteobacteria bacterium]
MLYYWSLFLIPAFFALIGKRRDVNKNSAYTISMDPVWWMIVLILVVIIGLRDQVGGDWFTYILEYNSFYGSRFSEIYSGTSAILDDPLYNLINWISLQFDWGIYGVNLICAFIFSIGLCLFCRHLPRPMLALTSSIPYLVIVVSMGYTRQGVALGIAMIALLALSRNRIIFFVLLIGLAASAHKSAILLLPIAGLAAAKNRLAVMIWMFFLGVAGYVIFLQDSLDFLIYGYIDLEYQSEGAFIRLLMNFFPALLLIFFRNRFIFPPLEKRIWPWFSILSLFFMILFYLSPSSTAVDRMALYMLPLQLVVFSYLPDIFPKNTNLVVFLKYTAVAYYALVQYVWLNYANHAGEWVPYNNILL